MKTSENIDKIAPAFLKAQQDMVGAKKDSDNPFFKSKYADLNAVRAACMPALAANGIAVLQSVHREVVVTRLQHDSGQYFESETYIKAKNEANPQDYGSGTTYARRFGLESLCCLGRDDDDANSASGNEVKVVPSYKSNGFKGRYGKQD